MDVSPATKQAIDKANSTAAAKAGGGNAPRNKVLLTGGIAGGLIVVGIVIAALAMRGGEAPPLNAATVDMIKYVASPQFAKLPFDRQRDYMYVLESRDDNKELDKAFDDGKISEAEYRTVIQEAYLAQQLKRAEKYASLSGGQKAKYVRELAEKKEKDEAKDDAKPKDPNKVDKPHKAIKRDDALEDARIASFPPDVKERLATFRAAYKQAREEYRAAHQKPSTSPSKSDK